MEKATLLPPGKYSFQCKCGGEYRVMTLSEKTRVSTWCWYCRDYSGKYVLVMEDQILEFNENWNGKLNCKAFTTLRLRNDRKFYKGARFQVYLKKVYKGTATVKSVSILTLDRINDFIAWLDTGYSAEECRDIILTMYKGRGLFTKENEKRQELSFVLLVYEAKKEMNDLFDTNK